MEFFNSAVDTLQTIVVGLGGALCVWGGVNLLEGYGADNPANLLTSVNSLNKKIIKNLLPGAVEHPATLISRQYSLSAENHRNGSSEIINRHLEIAGNAEIQ